MTDLHRPVAAKPDTLTPKFMVAVISAVGTRQYYLERGFERGELYLVKSIF